MTRASDVPLPTREELGREAAAVVAAAVGAGLSVGTAESCTGGLVSAALTSVAGSSAVVRGAVVSYAIEVKRRVLGVSPEVLDEPSLGAVSSECARMMAEGARRVLGADVCVSVTGIAGPGGAEPGKPVGTVWFGVSSAHGASASRLCRFEGGREEVRAKAVHVALSLLREALVTPASA
ncbi:MULTISPECIES: CinA family protein [Olsenella]|uniref:CinA family protein n=1 Tax=Olsenella TaxID=133925 RepID=UPI000231F1E4|nr:MULTISPECIES: nicotinamide-nucleotide amidohydrolase family protein [Olsenella]EHF01850.1 hypothetical protein HMPREF1008_01474 [Olsenella sp. oral taxon 809 str. F0356]KXB62531.1 competence/damage-inducible protein CinA domain protein [Olsenella sp. DNF00959]